MDILEKVADLKKQVEIAKQKAHKAEGALEQTLKQIQEDFHCSSLDEAEKKLKTIQEEYNTAQKEFNKELEAFEEKWADVL